MRTGEDIRASYSKTHGCVIAGKSLDFTNDYVDFLEETLLKLTTETTIDDIRNSFLLTNSFGFVKNLSSDSYSRVYVLYLEDSILLLQ